MGMDRASRMGQRGGLFGPDLARVGVDGYITLVVFWLGSHIRSLAGGTGTGTGTTGSSSRITPRYDIAQPIAHAPRRGIHGRMG